MPAGHPVASEPAGDPPPATGRQAPDRIATDAGGATHAEEAPSDGRAARAARTRTAIVDALLSLLEEGDLQPPASRIAERAGISLRLIYHHFGDLESLFQAVSAREAERLRIYARPIDPSLPLDERIDELVRQRSELLEIVTPVRRAALLQEPFSEQLRATRDAFQQVGSARVRELFAPELDALPPHRRAAVADAAAGVLLWGFWNDLRTLGRSPDEAAAAIGEVLRGLLRG